MHRRIRILDQGIPIAPILGKNTDANTGSYFNFIAIYQIRAGNRLQQFGRHRAHIFRRIQIGQNNNEIITALPTDRIAEASHSGYTARYFLQQLVSNQVSQRVINRLEAIQIEVQHRHFTALPRRANDGLLQTIMQQHPVG